MVIILGGRKLQHSFGSWLSFLKQVSMAKKFHNHRSRTELPMAKRDRDTKHEQSYWPRREKTCLWGFANNTGADQPAHPRSLISAFVIRFLESIICRLATGEISFL